MLKKEGRACQIDSAALSHQRRFEAYKTLRIATRFHQQQGEVDGALC
jgi:hypothetical protein